METDATPKHRRDALIAAVTLLLLGGLWLFLRLYWQGALLALAGAGLGALAWRRDGEAPASAPGEDAEEPEASARRTPGGKAKGKRKRR